MRPSSIAWIFCGVALLCVASVYLAHQTRDTQNQVPVIAAAGQIGGAFQLINQDGAIVTDKAWPGKFLLLYFGFTHCPDVCPTGLNKIAEAVKTLDSATQSRLQPIFITVDPERDDVAALKEYLPLFDAHFVGLTGTIDQINAVKKLFKVYAEKQGDGNDYMVNHSSYTYLLDPQGNLVGLYAHEMSSASLGDALNKAIKLNKN